MIRVEEADKWVLIDTGYACGSVAIKNDQVIYCDPIFRGWAPGLSEKQLRQRVKVIDEYNPFDTK